MASSTTTVHASVSYKAPRPDPATHEPASKHSWCCSRRVHHITTPLSGCYLLQKAAAPALNPAVSFKEAELRPLRDRVLAQEGVQSVTISTHDGASINGVLIKSPMQPARAAMLLVVGRNNCWEHLACDGSDGSEPYVTHKLADFLRKNICPEGVDLLLINPRGIGLSKGDPSYEGWTTDVYSALRFLVSKGYPKIGAYGYSAGGWITVQPVHWLQQELLKSVEPKPDVFLVTDRAPKDLALAAFYYVRHHANHELFKGTRFEATLSDSLLTKGLGFVASHVAFVAARHSEWSAPVSDSLEAIPPERKLLISARHDTFVDTRAVVRRPFDDTPSAEDDYHLEFEAADGVTAHTAEFPPDAAAVIVKRMRGMLGLGMVSLVASAAVGGSGSDGDLRRRATGFM